MIDETLARTTREQLSIFSGEFLEDFTSEIQDDFTFLFLTCRLPYGGLAEVPKELRSQIVATLNEMIPTEPNQTLGSWQLNVNHGAAVVDALFPNEV